MNNTVQNVTHFMNQIYISIKFNLHILFVLLASDRCNAIISVINLNEINASLISNYKSAVTNYYIYKIQYVQPTCVCDKWFQPRVQKFLIIIYIIFRVFC